MSEANEEFVSPKEIAHRTKVSLKTVYRWLKKNKIEGYRIGGRVLFLWRDIKTAMQKTRRKKNRMIPPPFHK